MTVNDTLHKYFTPCIQSAPCPLLPAKVTERFTLLSGDDWREKLAEEIGEPEVAERLRAYIDT